jgi:hypothetical protein
MQRLAFIGFVAALGFVVAGCGGSGSRHSLVVPVRQQVWHRVNLRGVGARFISPTRLAFLTSGSSSCPSVPYQLIVQSADSVRINLAMGSWRPTHGSVVGQLVAQPPPKGSFCTTDLLVSPVAIAIDPTKINIHRPLKVNLYYPLAKKPTVFTAPAI